MRAQEQRKTEEGGMSGCWRGKALKKRRFIRRCTKPGMLELHGESAGETRQCASGRSRR